MEKGEQGLDHERSHWLGQGFSCSLKMTEYVWGMVEGSISGLHLGVRFIFIRRDIGITQMATHRITV